MSTLKNRVREEFNSDPMLSFDPSVGYVRIPQSIVDEFSKKYDELVIAGKLKESERNKFLKQFDEENKIRAEADANIKEHLGDEHFYGEVGTPLLLGDRWRFGMS